MASAKLEPVLSQLQTDAFQRDGVLTVADAVSAAELAALRDQVATWVDESRSHAGPFGETLDGRARFDVQPGHSATAPALRRVASPTEVSDAFFDVATSSAMVDMVADLIGANVKLHHTKINSKLPGAGTAVKWHQDFLFTPHSNDSLVTALLMIDEVTEENGPLEVSPGSHAGPLHSLWIDGVYRGAMADETADSLQRDAVSCGGSAGSVCLMHTRLAHGSAPNRSGTPRTLFIVVYSAGDAVPLARNPLPSVHDGMFVRGSDPYRVRATDFQLELPEHPDGASFFTQQEQA